jgi:hypothetical protein
MGTTLHAVRSRLAIAASSALIVLGGSFAGGCATQPSTQSGFIGDYANLSPAPTEANLGDGRIKAQRPDRQALARYDRVLLEHVVIKASNLDTDQVKALTSALSQALVAELGKEWAITNTPGPTALRLRVAVTDVTQASVLLNVLTTALIGPMSNGGAAGEAEVLDSQSSQRLAALTWADQRRFSEVFGFYSATGHARSLMPNFASTIARLIARQ